jgi:hypothetical protein
MVITPGLGGRRAPLKGRLALTVSGSFSLTCLRRGC